MYRKLPINQNLFEGKRILSHPKLGLNGQIRLIEGKKGCVGVVVANPQPYDALTPDEVMVYYNTSGSI